MITGFLGRIDLLDLEKHAILFFIRYIHSRFCTLFVPFWNLHDFYQLFGDLRDLFNVKIYKIRGFNLPRSPPPFLDPPDLLKMWLILI